MKKETERNTTIEQNPTAQDIEVKAEPHPAEVEAANLRNALAEERFKTEALSRRCIRLGDALEAAIRAEDNRVEKGMFDIINGNNAHRKAMTEAGKRRRAYEQKAAAAYEKACRKNALFMCVSVVIGFCAVIFGFTGFIHTALAATIAGVALVAFGWALNDCVHLLGRCE